MSSAASLSFFDPFGFQRAAADIQRVTADMFLRATVETSSAMMNGLKAAAEIVTGQKEEHRWDISLKPDALLRSDYGPLLLFAPQGQPHDRTAYIVPPISFSEPEVVNPAVQGFAENNFNVAVNHWAHPKEFAKDAADFTLDKQVDQIIDGLIAIYHETGKPAETLMGISQSTVPVALAAALMEKHGHPAAPKTMLLFAGPYNVWKNPTSDNKLAARAADDCFDAMFPRMPKPLLRDMTQKVFKDPAVAEGRYAYKGKYDLWHGAVDPAEMKDTATFIAEGKRDPICYVGQTSSFFDRSALAAEKRGYILRDTDHYGVFDFGGKDAGAFRKGVLDFIEGASKPQPKPRMAPKTRATAPASTLIH
jgi:poly-beta-hydroxyalkanoate depolymerase